MKYSATKSRSTSLHAHLANLAAFLLFSLPAAAQTLVEETIFISEQSVFSENQRKIAQNSTFTVYTTSTYIFRFAADYSAYAAVIAGNDVSDFLAGRSFSRYGDAYDSQFGTRSVTLGPGTYAIGIRNKTSSSNHYTVEFDKVARFNNGGTRSNVFNEAETVNDGGRLWHPFTIQSGYYYHMDGSNSGLDTFIIPASELSNFRNGSTFSHYSAYSGIGDKAMPGSYVIDLSPGSYYLCFRNNSGSKKAVTYTLDRFAILGGGGGPGGGYSGTVYPKFSGGRAAWRTRGSLARLTIPTIRNASSTRTTGTLRVYLMAHRSRSAVSRGAGKVIAIATYGQLRPNTYYRARSVTTRRYRGPRGRVYTAMILAEYIGRYTRRDSRTFPRRVRFSR